ncbi:MAG: IS3 family transposase [Peptostreptococcaceae bacterium]|nr:IS3 family transposase [Peptostreptococcaceae bacterium]
MLKSEECYLYKYENYDILEEDVENYINFYNYDRLEQN